jgi:PhnB protein
MKAQTGVRQGRKQEEMTMDKASEVSRRRFVASSVATAMVAALPAHSWPDPGMQTPGGNKMTTLTPYLLFDGTCQKAMEFYKSCFGGELTITKVKDSPAKDHMPAIQQEKTLNARLKCGNMEISASDWLMPGRTPVRGNTVCLFLSGGTLEELKALLGRLSEGAEVTDPLQEKFFGAYGALNDQFGVRWMFHANKQA